MVAPFLPDDQKIVALRDALPATGAGIYLDTGSSGPLPTETARAMAELADWELRTGRAHHAYLEEMLVRMAEARAAVAAILATSPEAIALTHGTTLGMNAGVWGLDWRPGDRVVTTSLEHAGGLGPLWALRERSGVELVIADVGDGGDDERTLAALDEAIGAPAVGSTGRTRLVAVSHVSWTTGAVLPVRRIADLAHAHGALLLVDGAQSVGAIPVSVEDLAADLYAVAGQKWLLGPEGTGGLYCSPEVLDQVRPTFAGWWSLEWLDLATGDGRPWPDARRFESGGVHGPSVVGLARSCSWLSMYVGLSWIHERVARLAQDAAALLAQVPGVELLTPTASMAGLVTFRIAGWPAPQAAAELGRRTFAILRTVPSLDALRISVGFFNTEAELARFRDGVAELADHTPEMLPSRRTLTILGQGDA
ncbi:MAG: aminotransferase class V-fold PLP-dependent enzyme [Candidatus Limnocylindrales bacterium]